MIYPVDSVFQPLNKGPGANVCFHCPPPTPHPQKDASQLQATQQQCEQPFYLFQFLKSAADEPQEVKHVKAWMKNNSFALVADFSGGEMVAR